MNRKKLFNLTDSQIDKIIAAAYGDGSIIDRLKVAIWRIKNGDVKKLYNEYRSTSRQVHELGEAELPNEVLNRIVQENIPAPQIRDSLLGDFAAIIFNRPVAAALASIVVLAALFISLFVSRPAEYGYSRQEIELADREARKALAIVGRIFNETKSTIENKILIESVGKPINEGFGIVNKLIIKENKNETD